MRASTNTLAVEVHQANTNSSDISFVCILAGQQAVADQSGQVQSPEMAVTLTGDTQIIAHFEVDLRGDNDLGENWRASSDLYGTPGMANK